MGRNYSLEQACKACGTGAEFKEFYPAKGLSNAKEDIFLTLDGDYLLSQKLYNLLTQVYKINLNQLLPVKNSRGQQLPFYWLHALHSFPKMDTLPEGVVVDKKYQCCVCKKNGYFGEPSKVYFTIKDKTILDAVDLFMSWEHYGVSNLKEEGNNVIRFARSELIVSEKIKNAFQKIGVKKVSFQEVVIK